MKCWLMRFDGNIVIFIKLLSQKKKNHKIIAQSNALIKDKRQNGNSKIKHMVFL